MKFVFKLINLILSAIILFPAVLWGDNIDGFYLFNFLSVFVAFLKQNDRVITTSIFDHNRSAEFISFFLCLLSTVTLTLFLVFHCDFFVGLNILMNIFIVTMY